MIDTGATLASLLEGAAGVLAAAGVADPRREAMRLWTGLDARGAAAVVSPRDQPVEARHAERFLAAVTRRALGEPMAYVTGWTGFRHLTVACDSRALIPRPETEGLVGAALARQRRGVAADIGTGTGAIALALIGEGDFDEVIATDLSPDALALARENGAAAGAAVAWLEGDLVAPLAGRTVDLLVSNPPYLVETEFAALDPSVRDYEPRMALVSGPDGLAATRRLLDEGRSVVRPGGWIAVEVDCRRADTAAQLAAEAGWRDIAVEDDLFGRARYLLARRGSE